MARLAMPSPDDLDLCVGCDAPIAEGEGRYRYLTGVHHEICWDAFWSGERRPWLDGTGTT